ncbi:site-specific integrase [Kistimonas scapharcae]|uniref:Site-specific integrase n=1 Tax=Kistimonas scapharcae TaxID=1036133 RepID=A0ABP8V4A4_9GAMM
MSRREFEGRLKRDVKAAAQLLARVQHALQTNEFNYADFFPDSKQGVKLGFCDNNHVTVEYYLATFLERAKTQVRPVTHKNYRKMVKYQLIPAFGEIKVRDLTPGMLRDWIHQKSHVTKRKTLSNIISPLKQALDDAVMDRIIDTNPARSINLDRIVTVESRQSEFKPDPFTEQEIEQLLSVMEGQVRNLFQFAFYTGMRTSELIAISWDKIDFINREILVDVAMVDGQLGKLKTADKGVKSRKILMLDEAMAALKAQKVFTFEQSKFVFHHPLTNKVWQNDTQIRRWAWQPAIRKAGLRYRNPYQTRHTYAHMLIRDNENLWWIASQMGHTGIEMLNRHYGGWIEESAERYKPHRRFSESHR